MAPKKNKKHSSQAVMQMIKIDAFSDVASAINPAISGAEAAPALSIKDSMALVTERTSGRVISYMVERLFGEAKGIKIAVTISMTPNKSGWSMGILIVM